MRIILRIAVALPTLVACRDVGPITGDLPIAFYANSFNAARGSDIFVRDVDGQNSRLLVRRDGDDFAPAWSPDGRRVAFTGNNGNGGAAFIDNLRIYVVNADGTDLHPITSVPSYAYGPAWSPDGNRIAFFRWLDPFTFGLAIMNADGSGALQIPNTNGAMTAPPSWHPDGSTLAFARSAGRLAIFTVRPDGSELTQLTFDDCEANFPAWSPDGSAIAYNCGTSDAGVGRGGLFTVNADGTNVRQLTYEVADGEPTWSPDGDRIMFTRWSGDRQTDLYAVRLLDGAIERLGATSLNERDPVWRPR
ncbi:MAG: hypothetical protein ACJ78M_01065 [Gemmatimonadaceae bacterium]